MIQHIRVCCGCQSAFAFTQNDGKCGRLLIYCSASCYPSHQKRVLTSRNCRECGAAFTPAGSRGPVSEFCSRPCRMSQWRRFGILDARYASRDLPRGEGPGKVP
jgi:hypothetical protein